MWGAQCEKMAQPKADPEGTADPAGGALVERHVPPCQASILFQAPLVIQKVIWPPAYELRPPMLALHRSLRRLPVDNRAGRVREPWRQHQRAERRSVAAAPPGDAQGAGGSPALDAITCASAILFHVSSSHGSGSGGITLPLLLSLCMSAGPAAPRPAQATPRAVHSMMRRLCRSHCGSEHCLEGQHGSITREWQPSCCLWVACWHGS